MKNNENHIDELLAKYLANEATAQEKIVVQTWLAEDLANAKHLDQLNIIFSKAAAVKDAQHFDTDAAWGKVKSKLNNKETRTIEFKPQSSGFTTWLRIAASIIVVLGIGFFLYDQFTKPTDHLTIKSNTSVVNDTLPDGSKTVLNKKSTLAYEYNPKKNTRKLKLKGEAYFDVKHEEEKPFIIETQQVIIEDIGTTFNVKSYEASRTIEVYVESGEVRFYTLQNVGLTLKQGETGIYDKVSKSFALFVKADTNILAYKTRIFNFNNTDLNFIIESINEIYDMKLKLANDNIGKCRITVSFKGETIESIADILAETLNLDIIKTENQIMLDGNGCPD